MGLLALVFLIVLGLVVLLPLATLTIDVIVALLVPMFIGYLAGQIMSGGGYGALRNVLLGFGGGIAGNLVLDLVNIETFSGGGLLNRVVVGVIGAIVLIALGRLFFGRDSAKTK